MSVVFCPFYKLQAASHRLQSASDMLGLVRFASVSCGSPLSMAGRPGDTYLIPSCCQPHMRRLQAGRGIEVCVPRRTHIAHSLRRRSRDHHRLSVDEQSARRARCHPRQRIAEGLTIVAWVSLWEALAMFLVNWAPHRRLIRMYERIAKADVRFQEVEHEA